MRRNTLALLALALSATLAHAQAPPGPLPGDPLPGLTAAQLTAFQDGRLAFTQNFRPQDGLGPIHNAPSCVACHGGPAPGGGSPRLVTRFGRQTTAGFDPMAALGGSLLQDNAIQAPTCNPAPEVVPIDANVRALRRSQPVFGLGLVDAVPDATLQAIAAQQRALTPALAGRVSLIPDNGVLRAGRFGWKAQQAVLATFSGDAMLNELGLTNPRFPTENCPNGDCARIACNPRPAMNDDGRLVARMTSFQAFLAPIAPLPPTAQTVAGEQVFNRLTCNACHVSTMQTGPSTVAALDRKTFKPYSDFLLHDMGALGDGIVQAQASGREMRTAPLWGLRFSPRLLHDGRAGSPDAAIRQHDGQGAASRDAYLRLNQTDRNNLLAFLSSL